MEILLIAVVVILILYFIGKLRGDPDPSGQSEEWLNRRLTSESNWVNLYRSLPVKKQASLSLTNAYLRRSAYIQQLENEIKTRKEIKEMANAGRSVARTITTLMKSENIDMNEAALLYLNKLEDVKKHAQQEILQRETDARVLKERFEACAKYYQSKGYTEQQSRERAVRQIEREDAEKKLQDAIIAADTGDANSQFNAAQMFESQQNWRQSVDYYWKAASQGHKEAIDHLGDRRPIHYDYLTEAQKELLLAWKADAGDGLSQKQLGIKYLDDGIYDKAFHWLSLAANSKGAFAAESQYYLATLYAEGKGVAKNDDIALGLFVISAEQGYGCAQYRLGLIYKIGNHDVSVDLELAYFWLSLSLSASGYGELPYRKQADGSPSITEALEVRNSISELMTSSQIERVKLQIKEWRKK